MYTANDFNTQNAPKEMVQHVIDNVADFDTRYNLTLDAMGRDRCPLRVASYGLYSDIEECMGEWCNDNDDRPDLYDIEEIFG